MAKRRSEPTLRKVWLGRVHRWLGLGSIAFVLLLSTTGIVLNHTDDLSLDSVYLSSPWLLEWYGVESPAAQASFETSAHRVTLLGQRLYFDDSELADGVATLVGAVSTPSFTAIATAEDVLLISADGRLVERVDAHGFLSSKLTDIGVAGPSLVLRSGNEFFETDENLLSIDPCLESDIADIQWSAPSSIPRADLLALQELYRGRGITLERLILDLHSGKVLTRAGPILIDAAGVLFIALSLFGLAMWYGRKSRSN